MKDWAIHGFEIANCNCVPGCPCQFSQLPNDGTCEAMLTFRIDKGHYGETVLDGLLAAAIYKWPGPIHEGNGEMQIIIDERATAEQKSALEAIMTGQDTEEFATMFFVFNAMCTTKHETLSAPVSLSFDAETGIGHGKAGSIGETKVEPIAHIVSGAPHSVQIKLPNGFEYSEASVCRGTTQTPGSAISLNKNSGTHAHVAELHLTGKGVERAA
ncbi:DUF1326 domain-containing protein [Leisingera aquaemixtae]|uniref:DUF1326 domain-containing protein n=1 Tax=Leisingera TaxID=191028 RepID=UPI001C975A48|nr:MULTISPECIES: DUF1326 domain-containing protein [Leisingera]MBY6066945.1 DUF1326 domain-containing protein [Leisingera aquaemixtae]MCB4455226.1 DUF1326 domain-containing protein [Leisingera sp. McT4-56]